MVRDIKEAIKIMGFTQLGIELTDEEISKITAFLNSTTGRIPEGALNIPVLPPFNP
jgi:cytochrome c peroxidase